ncbi:MAG: hypothetical protein JWN67_2870 [Actinomycetia bacterium]|nr:hypothetical protein [Actinomycetes bacterium]
MTPARRGLVGLLLAGIALSTSTLGTFATFSASTTNGSSAFSSGSIVLSDQVNGGTACLSAGTTATNNVNTDTNANANCAAALAVTNQKPGDVATASLQIQNVGSLAATTGLSAYSSGGCVDGNDTGTYHGTGSACGAVQTYLQETSSSGVNTACRYGKGGSGVISSTARTFPIVISSTTRQFNLSVDGTAHNALLLTAGSYSAAAFTTHLNSVIGTWATAAVGLDNVISISSKTINGPSSSTVTIANGATNNALPTLGFTTGTTNAGGQTTCAFDAVHTLAHLTANYASLGNSFAIGTLAVSSSKYFVVGATLPLAAGNDLMGRQATFAYSFTAQQ